MTFKSSLLMLTSMVLFAVTGTSGQSAFAQGVYVHVQFDNVRGGGHFKLYQGGNEVTHGGLDKVVVQNGTGTVLSASATQFNYDGNCGFLYAGAWISNPFDRIEVRTTSNTRVNVSVGIPPKNKVNTFLNGTQYFRIN